MVDVAETVSAITPMATVKQSIADAYKAKFGSTPTAFLCAGENEKVLVSEVGVPVVACSTGTSVSAVKIASVTIQSSGTIDVVFK